MMARLVALLRKSGEWIAPIAAVSMVFVMLVPLPSFILDLLLTISITASMLVLLTAIQILRPVQFSVFPACCCYSHCFACRSTWPARAAFCCMAMRAPRLQAR
jgi:flagellar biosynthesis component FlhA